MSSSKRTVVFVTFETPLTPCGGLAAVMDHLPRALKRRERVVVITPHFPRIAKRRGYRDRLQPVARCRVPFRGKAVEIRVLELEGAPVTTYLVAAEGFFQGAPHPYQEARPGALLHDALLFSSAVPRALEAVEVPGRWILNLQDWQCAPVIGTVRELRPREEAACLLTLHNPYDQPVAHGELGWILRYPPPCFSVLAGMLSIHDGPVTTVSEGFAYELTADPLFTEVFADHLQPYLRRSGVAGIDNGMFGPHRFPFSRAARQAAEAGDFSVLAREKRRRRERLAITLGRYEQVLPRKIRDRSGPRSELGSWGEPLDLEDPSIPVFFMMGRDDPRQKGYDLAAAAIRRLPAGLARFVFTPMPGPEGTAGLGFLQRLAEERPGEVKVFTHRLPEEPFRAIQRGSSLLLMPSLYEPFGGANEAYLAGMPVVARATGGLIQQVLDDEPRNATGVLFREEPVDDPASGWREIVAGDYDPADPGKDRLASRLEIPLYRRMVDGLTEALERGVSLYGDQEAYSRTVWNGWRHLEGFTWRRAAAGYRSLYRRVFSA